MTRNTGLMVKVVLYTIEAYLYSNLGVQSYLHSDKKEVLPKQIQCGKEVNN